MIRKQVCYTPCHPRQNMRESAAQSHSHQDTSHPLHYSHALNVMVHVPISPVQPQPPSISTVASSVDFPTMLEALLRTIAQMVSANAGYIRLLPPNTQTRQIVSAVGLSEAFLEHERRICPECGICGKSLTLGIYAFGMGTCQTRSTDCFFGEEFKSVIFCPLENGNGDVVGTMTLFFLAARNAIPEHALDSVSNFAKLINTAVAHNQYNRETRRTELIAERQSMANEIHDSLAQTLMYARMRANLLIESIRVCNELMAAQYAHDIDETLENCQKTVRTLITDFRCEIDPSGLLQALNQLTLQFKERHGIALEYTNRVGDLDFPLEFEIQIYYIVREALSNIATHSNATHARLVIDQTLNDYVFTIEDNGRGGYTFTPIEGHYGMLIMRERATRIGGEIKIESSEGLGTLVQLFLPYSAIKGGNE